MITGSLSERASHGIAAASTHVDTLLGGSRRTLTCTDNSDQDRVHPACSAFWEHTGLEMRGGLSSNQYRIEALGAHGLGLR